jgi:DNA polymerase-4
VQTERAARSIGEENTFERDVSDGELVLTTLAAHADVVARRLRRSGHAGQTVTIKVKLARQRDVVGWEQQVPSRLYPVLTRQLTLREATNDVLELRRVAEKLWKGWALVEPVRLLGLSVSKLTPASTEQLNLFDSETPHNTLGSTLDAIQRRYGDSAIKLGADRPEKLTPSGRVTREE